MTSRLGILGHKEFAHIVENREIDVVSTPFGDQPIEKGMISNTPVVWIRFPGWEVDLPSHAIDKRRHVAALKILGIDHYIDITGFGAVNRGIEVGDIAISSDLLKLQPIDPPTLMPDGGWPRVNPGEAAGGPFCSRLRQALIEASTQVSDRKVHRATVVSHTTGPHAETAAEIEAARRMGADLISTSLYATVIYGLELNIFGASFCWVSNIAGDEYRKDWVRMPAEEVRDIMRVAVQRTSELTCNCADTPDDREFNRYPEEWKIFW